jgi:hypothetical protein
MADNFFPELPPRYGTDPSTGSEVDWPSADSGYDEKVRYWLEAKGYVNGRT